jgi:hypothetical protein
VTKKRGRIAYLILAHNNPRMLSRLVRHISTSNSDVYIHVDAKSEIEPFAELRREGVYFTPERVHAHWADFSLVAATLLLIRTALAAAPGYDRLVLLSGADYPLRPCSEIEDFLLRDSRAEFMNMVAMPSVARSKPISRLTTYRRRPGLRGLIAAAARRGLVMAGVIPKVRNYRRVFGEIRPFAGSQWWALTASACAYILEFARLHPGVMRFFENTHCPDEMVFQTIIGNSPFAARIRRNITYTDWSTGGPSPSSITARHIEMFRAARPMMMEDEAYGSGIALFCRKMTDMVVADQFDALLREAQQAATSAMKAEHLQVSREVDSIPVPATDDCIIAAAGSPLALEAALEGAK